MTMRPLGISARRGAATFVLALSVFARPCRADDALDNIVAGLAKAEEAIETLHANYLCLEEITLLKPGAKHDPRFVIADNLASTRHRAQVRWEAHRDGRSRIEANIEAVNTRDDGTSFDSSERHMSTFNGSTGQWAQTERVRDGVSQPAIARTTQQLMRTHSSPFDFAAQHLGKPLAKVLVERQAKIVVAEQWEKRPVVVVETEPVAVRDDYILRQQFWIDVERSAAVRRISYVQRGRDRPWGLHYQHDATRYVEAAVGVWLPQVVETLNYHVSDAGQDFLTHKARYEIVEWEVNNPIDERRFELDQTEGAINLDDLFSTSSPTIPAAR